MICIPLKSLAVDDSVQKPYNLWNQKLSTTRMPPPNNAYNSNGRNLMNSGVFIGQIATFLTDNYRSVYTRICTTKVGNSPQLHISITHNFSFRLA